MSAQKQVELIRPEWRTFANREVRSDTHTVTWVDAADAVVGKEIEHNGKRWKVHKAYSIVQK